MAKEYIEREALMNQLMKKKADVANKRYTEGFNDALLRIRSMVHSAKAADVVPMEYHERCLEIEIQKRLAIEPKHGRWVPIKRKNIWGDETDVLECSACKKSDVDGKGITKRSDYCPDCGARMDGE